jgi:hypothetical protein
MSSEAELDKSIKVFLSYSPKDERLKKKLELHLNVLKRKKYITWNEQQILAGAERDKEISKHFEDANLILCLISPDFIHSDYCYEVSMPQALEKQKRGEATVIPILLKWVDWKNTPFYPLQIIPRDEKPIEGRSNPNKILEEVVEDIQKVVETLRRKNG